MPRLTRAHRQAIETVLAARPNIIAAWLFGSAQSGELRPGSDLDIGVLFQTSPARIFVAGIWGSGPPLFRFGLVNMRMKWPSCKGR